MAASRSASVCPLSKSGRDILSRQRDQPGGVQAPEVDLVLSGDALGDVLTRSLLEEHT